MFFEQVAVPGREAAIDFTHATDLEVTIGGEPLPHLLFEFVLSYSGWRWVSVAFGETFEALVAGLQDALWALGGVPAVLRSDNLSAATHELKYSSGRDRAAVRISPAGDAISGRELDVDVSVRGLLERERRARRVDFHGRGGQTT